MTALNRSDFVWRELMTTDVAAARRFYTRLLGWQVRDAGLADRSYSLFACAGTDVAGALAIPPATLAAGLAPCWVPYVGVADVDQTAFQLQAEGGGLHHGPETVAGVGRFATVTDLQGALFNLFCAAGGSDGGAPANTLTSAQAMRTTGQVGWYELNAAAGAPALAFYQRLFGWTATGELASGSSDAYRFFAPLDETTGAVTTRRHPGGRPHWLLYFNVHPLQAALDCVQAEGGQVLEDAVQVPTGSWVARCADPQGARFALVSQCRV